MEAKQSGWEGLPTWLKIIIVLGTLAVIGIIANTDPGDESPTDTEQAEQEPETSYKARVMRFAPIDEANLQIIIEFRNTGDEKGTPQCTFAAVDASGSTTGFDFISPLEPIKPGKVSRGNTVLRIEDEGAFRVQDVEVSDCDEA